MKKAIIFTLLSFSIITVNAQKYRNAVGIRLSDPAGITYKYHYQSNTKLEGILELQNHAFTLTGLYEKYHRFPSFSNLDFYYGGGVFVGFWSFKGSSNMYTGIKGVIGLCYTFTDVPIDVSLDLMPALQIISESNFKANNFGLSVRYTF